jgi:tripartite-type tricarboxylate transporter receptor subunit TctC
MRRLVIFIAAAAMAWGATLSHAADAFPSKSVRIIVPYSAGGPIDILARGLSVRLADDWKQAVITGPVRMK